MFLLFGVRGVASLLGVLRFRCSYCGQDARQEVLEVANRLTLFFIPVLTFSRRYVNRCTNCGGETRLTERQARRGLESGARGV